ncbi:DUF3108 domain-containing protein [Kordiimonas lacus]|uniref:DUF3108 domain-containing protein n=1 Tax=Kordiimonas lacus TaxID=637679 RepID=A0A1G7F1T3_9PROT|nr:DUF3108 domain-containing protein [Kordiimonas lacus]SDE69812.1 Protein of unknown function [Kordiimonas lacus]
MKTYIGMMTGTLLAVAGGGQAMAAERLEVTYDFIWKGLLVSTAEARADLAPESYDLAIDFRMRGLAKLFANGRSELRSNGSLVDGDILPREYISAGRWDGEDYMRTLRFAPDGMLKEIEQDWPEKWEKKYPREEVPTELRRGPDPASLAIALLRARITEAQAAEPFTIQVFDGAMVFEWQVSCGPELVEISDSRHSDFAGEAHECTIGGELVAGKRILTEKEKKKLEKEREKRRRKAEKNGEDDDMPPKFWVMPKGDGGYLVPVRAEVQTDMGRVHMYLKELAITDLEDVPVVASR